MYSGHGHLSIEDFFLNPDGVRCREISLYDFLNDIWQKFYITLYERKLTINAKNSSMGGTLKV